jgi:hypothetical protein
MKRFLLCALALTLGTVAYATEDDELPATYLSTAHTSGGATPAHAHRQGLGQSVHGIPFIDSLANWSDKFKADGVDQNGDPQKKWFYNMVGTAPNHHGTTTFHAPIVPVSLDLRNADGSPRFVNGHRLFSDVTPFIAPVLASPVFQNATFTSSPVPTQFTDAVQRAEFYSSAKSDWHTLLAPSVKTPRTIQLRRGTYQFALNADGTCCLFVLVERHVFGNALFPADAADTTTPVGAAENAGEVTTKDISTFLFPNTYLFDGATGDCCVLGFHTYDFEPGDDANGNVEKRYVLNYSSWITAGLFGAGFADITALSHEIAETFNDPFVASDGVHNITPWWLAPNGLCQDNLEDGDVIEGLPNATYPMTMNGMTYHPQNEALLQWFIPGQASDAIDGAYSYPNETVLSSPTSFQNFECQ